MDVQDSRHPKRARSFLSNGEWGDAIAGVPPPATYEARCVMSVPQMVC